MKRAYVQRRYDDDDDDDDDDDIRTAARPPIKFPQNWKVEFPYHRVLIARRAMPNNAEWYHVRAIANPHERYIMRVVRQYNADAPAVHANIEASLQRTRHAHIGEFKAQGANGGATQMRAVAILPHDFNFRDYLPATGMPLYGWKVRRLGRRHVWRLRADCPVFDGEHAVALRPVRNAVLATMVRVQAPFVATLERRTVASARNDSLDIIGAIRRYTYASSSHQNEVLRMMKRVHRRALYTTALDPNVSGLQLPDSAAARARLTNDVGAMEALMLFNPGNVYPLTVYRGVRAIYEVTLPSGDNAGAAPQYVKVPTGRAFEPGTIVTPGAFTSTSPFSANAMQFTRSAVGFRRTPCYTCCIFRIHLPAGYPRSYVTPYSSFDEADEQEILLPPYVLRDPPAVSGKRVNWYRSAELARDFANTPGGWQRLTEPARFLVVSSEDRDVFLHRWTDTRYRTMTRVERRQVRLITLRPVNGFPANAEVVADDLIIEPPISEHRPELAPEPEPPASMPGVIGYNHMGSPVYGDVDGDDAGDDAAPPSPTYEPAGAYAHAYAPLSPSSPSYAPGSPASPSHMPLSPMYDPDTPWLPSDAAAGDDVPSPHYAPPTPAYAPMSPSSPGSYSPGAPSSSSY